MIISFTELDSKTRFHVCQIYGAPNRYAFIVLELIRFLIKRLRQVSHDSFTSLSNVIWYANAALFHWMIFRIYVKWCMDISKLFTNEESLKNYLNIKWAIQMVFVNNNYHKISLLYQDHIFVIIGACWCGCSHICTI